MPAGTHARLAVICIGALGCSGPPADESGGGSPAPDTGTPAASCDGRAVDEAVDIEHQLHLIGYWSVPPDETPETLTRVITDDAGWSDIVAAMSTDGGLAPDFSVDAAFSHAWIDNGCDPPFDYTVVGWDGGGRIRARASQSGAPGDCDAYFPKAALLVARGVAGADLGWCIAPAEGR